MVEIINALKDINELGLVALIVMVMLGFVYRIQILTMSSQRHVTDTMAKAVQETNARVTISEITIVRHGERIDSHGKKIEEISGDLRMMRGSKNV